MILMIVAVSCGLGASYMTSRLLAERGAETEKVIVLVAKKNLNMGDIVKVPEDMFVEKQFTKGEEPRLALNEPDKLKGRVLKRSLRPGDFVTPDDLFGENDSPGLWTTLPQGFRAVGIRVNPETIAGGFASLPHSRVDILNTVKRGDDRSNYSEIILEDVLVLAADQSSQRDETGRAMMANVVTVALKPEDALKLELAKNVGTISLMLRKFNDKQRAEGTKLTYEKMKQGLGASTDIIPEESDASPPSTISLPPLPPLTPTPAPKDEKVAAPAPPKKPGDPGYSILIIEGDNQRRVPLVNVDQKGRPISVDVQRSEVPQPDAKKDGAKKD
jgi:pilus assembly protein CpaB